MMICIYKYSYIHLISLVLFFDVLFGGVELTLLLQTPVAAVDSTYFAVTKLVCLVVHE
jgi:hypothetical protein